MQSLQIQVIRDLGGNNIIYKIHVLQCHKTQNTFFIYSHIQFDKIYIGFHILPIVNIFIIKYLEKKTALKLYKQKKKMYINHLVIIH